MGFWSRVAGAIGAGRAPAIPANDTAATPPAAPAAPAAPGRAGSRWSADGLVNMAAGLGDNRDKRSYAEYTLNAPITKNKLEALFMSSWLAARIVTTPADDMTREWVDLSWDGHDDDQGDDHTIREEEVRLDIRGRVNEALTWARLYGGSVVLIGMRDEDLASPLVVANIKQGTLECLLVYDRWWVSGGYEVDEDANSPNFGMPLFYEIVGSTQRVHWTRVVRFNGRKLPKALWQMNGGWDASELAHVIDNITDYDTVRAAMASMVYEANVDIMAAEDLSDALATADGEAKVRQRFAVAALMKSMNRMMVIDKNRESWQQKTTSFAGVTNVFDKFILDVSGAADIPITRLFGQSPAGMTATGESDIRNYYDHIAAKQQSQLRAPLARLYEVLVRSAIGAFPKNFAVKFKALWQMSAAEKAAIQKSNSERDITYLTEGVVTEGLIARQLKADNVYSVMEDDDVDLAVELAKHPPEPAPPAVVPPGGAPPRNGAPRAPAAPVEGTA